MSYIFTSNEIKLRGLLWYNSQPWTSTVTKTFVRTDGTEFTGYYGNDSTGKSINAADSGYSSSILGYSPYIYVSSDKTALSRDDYALPDDVTQISWSTAENSVDDANGVSTILHAYYVNDTEEDITINKVLIVGRIATGTQTQTYGQALLFEELLDTPVTLAAGERWARNFEFRLEVA